MEFSPLPQQRLAIHAPLGPTLVVAGPGAGKTFCLIGRINHLIAEQGFQPGKILAVTFTNKAADEVAGRLKKALGLNADLVQCGTLHALCLDILREHPDAAGMRKGFGVADEQYQRAILGRMGIHPKRRSALLTLFSRRRLQRYRLTTGDQVLYEEYNEALRKRGMVDFDGLISRTKRLLRQHPDIARTLAARWDYVLVDEFQDLNAKQYEILKQLSAPHQNFFAVGDDEQSIFSWTGADPFVLARFQNEFHVTPIILDVNKRCSRQIFETARRVLAENRQIFDKQLTADRESPYPVQALSFADDTAEAAWLLDDLAADRGATGLGWGDYAILYRHHKTGEQLEGLLVTAGIPCRLARGRAIAEDKVVGYVIAALRVVRDPQDSAAMLALAELVFSDHLLEAIRAFADTTQPDFLESLRAFARQRPRSDPDTKRVWEFVYRVENLAALPVSHPTLGAAVAQLLTQRMGATQNRLEERHDELTDPATTPSAIRLAQKLQHAIASDGQIAIEPLSGMEIALRGMLAAAGLRRLPLAAAGADLVITAADGGSEGLPFVMFKALQLLQAQDLDRHVSAFIAFDLETTDNDPDSCDIIEIGAAKVRDGAIVDRFHSLVRPTRPISPAATTVHGRTDADVADAKPFAEVWPEFRAFVGDDLLVAHNGQLFDVPVLRRVAGSASQNLVFYDTLPLARSLSSDSAKLADLASRFEIDGGTAHHALDDAVTLARVFGELERQRVVRARKSVLVNILDYLGLALAIEHQQEPSDEWRLLFDVARFHTLGRYSDSLTTYALDRARTGVASPAPDELIDRLGGQDLMNRLRAERDPEQKYPAAVARLRTLLGPDAQHTIEEGLDRVLERVALSTSEGVEVAPDHVTLLTLHSTKGLEFSRVYVVGVEDYSLPGYYAFTEKRDDEIQEARRLLYVGMTRAKDRLVLTRVDQRGGRESGGSTFLQEMQLTPEQIAPADSPY